MLIAGDDGMELLLLDVEDADDDGTRRLGCGRGGSWMIDCVMGKASSLLLLGLL